RAPPAPIAILSEGLLESVGGGDRAVVMAGAALGVARAVERRKHLLAEFARLLQNGAANIGSGVRETRQIVIASDPEDLVEEKQDVLGRGFVDRHGSPSSAWHRLTSESGHMSPPSGPAC